MLKIYRERVNLYLLSRNWYTLVDAIEEVIDLTDFGFMHTIPLHTSYVPPS